MSNRQRALWAFLFYTLVGPFLAAVALAVVLAVAPLVGLPLPSDLPPLGVVAAGAFSWSVIPAALAALVLVPFVLRRGRFGWIEAAVAGVAAFTVAAILVPFPHYGVLAWLAFLAGLASIAVWAVLTRARVLTRP